MLSSKSAPLDFRSSAETIRMSVEIPNVLLTNTDVDTAVTIHAPAREANLATTATTATTYPFQKPSPTLNAKTVEVSAHL